MKNILFIIIFASSFGFSACSQQSEYVNSFDWMVQTFEENEAGFSYYLDKIGEDKYKKHVSEYRKKIGQTTSEEDFLNLMNEWLHYFRKGHISFYPKSTNKLAESQKDSIRELYRNEEIVMNEPDFKKHLTENKLHPLEGIWESRHEKVGIKQIAGKSNQFEGFILKADSIYWFPGQKVFDLTMLNDSTADISYFTKNRMVKSLSSKYTTDANGIFYTDEMPWLMKTYPEIELSQEDSLYQLFLTSGKPFIKKISPQTIYLRFPSFRITEIKCIEDLIAINDQLIRSTPNLIIDIRYGTGGSDYSHSRLMPYYYTQPIRHLGLKYRATELNAQMYKKLHATSPDSSYIKNLMSIEKKLMENLGKNIDFSNGPLINDQFTPLKYPEKIAIICNKHNGSADEYFLLSAKQSYKTKIFGTPTMGAFDFSNINTIDSPDGKYILCLAVSANKMVPHYMIDDIGIQPDFYIDNTIKEKEWVMYVKSVMETR